MEKSNREQLVHEKLVFQKPVLGFAAYSGTGKTTLLVSLIPLLRSRGLHVAMIKQTHHDFEIDNPVKDSYKLRKAGADQVLLASSQRCALITEFEKPVEPELTELVSRLELDKLDLVLVEGFKHLPFDKIELHRAGAKTNNLDARFIYQDDGTVIAIASDTELEAGALPLLDINNPGQIADFIESWLAD